MEGGRGLLTTRTSHLGPPFDGIAILDHLREVLWAGKTKTPGFEGVNVVLLVAFALSGEEAGEPVLPGLSDGAMIRDCCTSVLLILRFRGKGPYGEFVSKSPSAASA